MEQFLDGLAGLSNLTASREVELQLLTSDETRRSLSDCGVELISYAGLAAYSPVPALQAFRGPMLTVVLPGSDRPSSYQNLVPTLPAVKVKGLSHWLMMDDPYLFNGLLDGLLGKVT